MELIEQVIAKVMANQDTNRIEALHDVKSVVDHYGMYAAAQKYDVLVNNSGEEFAIQFMTTFNNEVCYSY